MPVVNLRPEAGLVSGLYVESLAGQRLLVDAQHERIIIHEQDSFHLR